VAGGWRLVAEQGAPPVASRSMLTDWPVDTVPPRAVACVVGNSSEAVVASRWNVAAPPWGPAAGPIGETDAPVYAAWPSVSGAARASREPGRLHAAAIRARCALVDPRTLDEVAALPFERKVPLATLAAWQSWWWIDDNAEVSSLVYFTDGSAVLPTRANPGAGSAGWAFVLFAAAHVQGGLRFGLLGASCGPGVVQHTAEEFIGMSWATAPAAELQALVEGLAGLHRCPELQGGLATFFGDSKIALAGVQGHCKAGANTELAHLGRHLLFASPVRVLADYVPAHSGVAPNEMADLLAELGRRGSRMGRRYRTPVAPSGRIEVASALMEAQAFWDSVLAAPDPMQVPLASQAAAEPLAIRLVSANVLTLRPAEEALSADGFTTRRLQLESIFHGLKVLAAGLQETRTKRSLVREGRTHIMLSAEAEPTGNYGVELWLARTFVVDSRDIFVVVSEPRRLVAKVRTVLGMVAFAVLHAVGYPAEEAVIQQWWDDTTTLLGALDRGVPLVCFMDGNCRVGQVRSPAIGPVGAVAECVGGAAMHAMLLAYGLVLPSTFGQGGQTWCSACGKRSRIDYVAVPSQWASAVVLDGVLPDHVLAIEDKLDHMAPFVDLQLVPAGCHAVGADARPQPWFNRLALRLPEVQAGIAEDWRAAHPFPSGMSADVAEAAFTKHGRLVLARRAPLDKAAPKQD